MRALYFGCWREPGHFFFDQGMTNRGLGRDAAEHHLLQIIDSTLCPSGPQVEGVANLTRLNIERQPVTVLSFWDRSVDARSSSNSNFILPCVLGFEAALAEARRVFPDVFARFTFPISEWRPASLPAQPTAANPTAEPERKP